MTKRRTLPKRGREVLRAFDKAGLAVELRSAAKHYLVYHKGELVYKFGQGTTAKGWTDKTLAATIRRLHQAGSYRG